MIDLFAPPSPEELKSRAIEKASVKFEFILEQCLEYFNDPELVSARDKLIIKGMLEELKKCAKSNLDVEKNWDVIYPTFLASIITFIYKDKKLDNAET